MKIMNIHEFAILLLIAVVFANTYDILRTWLRKPFDYPIAGIYYVVLALVLSITFCLVPVVIPYLDPEFGFMFKVSESIIVWMVVGKISCSVWRQRLKIINDRSKKEKSL